MTEIIDGTFWHDFQVTGFFFDGCDLGFDLVPPTSGLHRYRLTMEKTVALRLEASGPQIVVSSIDVEKVDGKNIEQVASFFRREDKAKVLEKGKGKVFVSIDTHVGMLFLGVCETVSTNSDR